MMWAMSLTLSELWEFTVRASYLLSNSPKHLPRLSPGYEGSENMLYFLTNSQWEISKAPTGMDPTQGNQNVGRLIKPSSKPTKKS